MIEAWAEAGDREMRALTRKGIPPMSVPSA